MLTRTMYNQTRDDRKILDRRTSVIKLREIIETSNFQRYPRFKDIEGDGGTERVPRIRKFSRRTYTRTLGGEGVARLFTGIPRQR